MKLLRKSDAVGIGAIFTVAAGIALAILADKIADREDDDD